MLIRQREKSDCSICTIAMALDKSYEEVMRVALLEDAWRRDEGCRREYQIIEKFGLKQMEGFRIMWRGNILDAEFFLHFSWRRKAILSVPSLNIEGGFHSVFTDGRKLYDPCLLKTYSEWKDLRPEEIILFAE